MNDTSVTMEECYCALFMQRTGEEGLMVGCAIRDTARAYVGGPCGNRTWKPPLRPFGKARSLVFADANETPQRVPGFEL